MSSDLMETSQSSMTTLKFSLNKILSRDNEDLENSDWQEIDKTELESDIPETTAATGYCIECEDQPAEVSCEMCSGDNFCQVCYDAQHRKGSRKSHTAQKLQRNDSVDMEKPNQNFLYEGDMENLEEEFETTALPQTSMKVDSKQPVGAQPGIGDDVGNWFIDRAKYIPLRLTFGERKYLRLLEAALSVSEYTDKIDTIGNYTTRSKRIVHQIREICAILSGLVIAADYKAGQELFADRDFESNFEFYQMVFELGRRHKIMNPEKMRSTYGKLVYLLQDSQSLAVKDMLNFACVKPITTVHSILEEADALPLLQEKSISVATQEIKSEGRTRREIQRDIKSKERAIEALADKYESAKISNDVVKLCLYSIGDNHAFLRANRDPCDRMIAYLKQYFHPTHPQDNKRSLTIRSGKCGARLSHDHAKQYAYVLQSLSLWREILHDMFRLWYLAEQDLLSEHIPYRLVDTGQGLNRVQHCPKTSRLMHSILNQAQKSVGSWVGSSVIHMGDTAVPNALIFIDKYSQIYRILLPICNTLSQIPRISESSGIQSYIDDEFGTTENLIVEILADFFKHAFDGAGADNFFDAGSCIDGRLTSAWNWCSTLEKKRYFPLFLLSGFTGFDGQW